MTWDTNINETVNKAKRTLGFVRRSLKISSSSIKEKSYKAFVRSLLEYASPVWGPYTQKGIDKLEAVQIMPPESYSTAATTHQVSVD